MHLPVEGWAVRVNGHVYLVKGCEHPLPCIHVIPRRLGRTKVKDPWTIVGQGVPVRWSPCLNVKLHMVCPWDDYDLLDPIARLEELISSGFRDPIIEQLYSVLGSSVGVTGSLLYGGEHRDIDIVVYGVRESVEALDLILEMFKSGKLAPPPYKEYNIVKREVGIKDWIYISRRNPLVFRDLGSNRVYSIRLVGCKEPVRCPDIVARSPVHASIVIVRHLTPPCVTPGLYECRARDGGKLVMLTLRSSLSCLPLGAMIEGIFILEQVKNGIARLVPDGGYVRIRLLQG